jgi:succinate dehydrogenase / fumarate reductase cytochrome b subunit
MHHAAPAPLPVDGARGAPRAVGPTSTTVGRKALVAASGLVWFGFLCAHLYTNLHFFAGAESFNAYYASLEANVPVYWAVRAALASSFLVHVGLALALLRTSAAARPRAYARKVSVATGYAARTMKLSGPILGAFIVYHLVHLTLGRLPEGAAYDPHDKYGNVLASFSVPWVGAVYALAMLLVGLHLWHGAHSAFRTLGAVHPRYERMAGAAATALTVVVTGGFLSIPVAVLAGLV